MKNILCWIFKKYRREFDDLYIYDMFGEIPPEVTEGTLRFLLTGKKQLDRWLRWEAYVLQRKMQQPLKRAEGYVGGLVFIQALVTMMNRMETEKRLFPSEGKVPVVNDVAKDLAGVDEFFE